MDLTEFEEIRPYSDEEAVEALSRISRHPAIAAISKYLFPKEDIHFVSRLLRSVNSIDEFQNVVVLGALNVILAKTTEGLRINGAENLREVDGKFLAISNHRDIVLDPALMQYAARDAGIPYTRICVGSNLLTSRLIEDLMRSNRMIKVIRGIGARELYLSSQRLSKYIRNSITSDEASVWIAQREGRTKDGLDITEQGILKMFDMSGEGSFIENFKALNIIPVSISYEYEPCDSRKAREIYIKRHEGSYTKKHNEDLHSILTGLSQRKGHITLNVGQPISAAEIESTNGLSGNERYQALRHILDERIVDGYTLYKTNYMGYDLMNNSSKYLGVKYLPADLEEFKQYTEHKLGKLERRLDRKELRDIFWHIYGNPVAAKED